MYSTETRSSREKVMFLENVYRMGIEVSDLISLVKKISDYKGSILAQYYISFGHLVKKEDVIEKIEKEPNVIYRAKLTTTRFNFENEFDCEAGSQNFYQALYNTVRKIS